MVNEQGNIFYLCQFKYKTKVTITPIKAAAKKVIKRVNLFLDDTNH